MDFIQVISYTGTFIFAATGALKARKHQMDIIGAVVMAFTAAYGGGTIRDVLIGIRPLSWMNDYLALLLVSLAVAIVFLYNKKEIKFQRTIFITDAMGLGFFTALGIFKSLQAGVNGGYAIIMGTIGATFGGLLTDIISNTVPDLLKKGELYATACLIGGLIHVSLHFQGTAPNTTLAVCVVTVFLIRIISKWKRIYLPEI